MLKKLNMLYLDILQAICYSLGSVLIFVLLANGLFNISPNFSMILPLTLLIYSLVIILTEYFEKSRNIDLIENKIFIISIILIVIISGILSSYGKSAFTYIFTIGYYGAILLVAISNNRNLSLRSLEAKIYLRFLKTFAITILISSIYLFDSKVLAYGNRVIDYIAIYFIASILHVICLNYTEQYETSGTVNKDRNIFILNSIVVFLSGCFMFFRKQIIYIIEVFKNHIEPGLDRLANSIIYKITAFFENLLRTDFGNFVKDNIGGGNTTVEEEFVNIEEGALEAVEEIVEQSNLDILYKIFLAIIVILIAYFFFIKVRKYMYKKQNKGSFEEREFIFKKEDLFNDIKNKFSNMFKKKENLSKARLVYLQTVHELINDGYEITNTTTPNEYISTILEGDIERYNFKKITSDYNADRYGRS